MRLKKLDEDSELMRLAETMLTKIDGVTPDSFRGNRERAAPTTIYLGYSDAYPVCVIETYNEFDKKLSLTNFAIALERQRCGYGRKFLYLIESEAIKMGMSEVTLISHPDSFGFYLKCGYLKYGSSDYDLHKFIGTKA